MEKYEELVARCRRDRVNELITNASMSHAGVLFENLFIAAQTIPDDEPRRMVIQCGNALPEFYGQFVDAALSVMNRGVKLDVLVCDPGTESGSNPFLTGVSSNRLGEVRVLADGDDDSVHFVVVGVSAYRVETDLTSVQAFANFNEPVVGTHLVKMFDRNWEAALPLFEGKAASQAEAVART